MVRARVDVRPAIKRPERMNMSKEDVKAEVHETEVCETEARDRRCLENVSRRALADIVEAVLTVMYPPGDISAQWSPDTMDELVQALGPNLIDAWVDEVEDETEAPDRVSVAGVYLVDPLDRDSLRRWADGVRAALADVDGVVRDALKPLARRELGRLLHQGKYADARARTLGLLALLDRVVR
jgi:hypothetical protein